MIQNYVDESPYCVNLWSAKLCEQSLIVINTKLNVAGSRKPAKSKVWTARILFFLNRTGAWIIIYTVQNTVSSHLTPSYNFVNLFREFAEVLVAKFSLSDDFNDFFSKSEFDFCPYLSLENLMWFDPIWTNFIWFEPSNQFDAIWTNFIWFEFSKVRQTTTNMTND